jgi:hypothetical protein
MGRGMEAETCSYIVKNELWGRLVPQDLQETCGILRLFPLKTLQAHSKKCKKWLLASSCPSVCPYYCPSTWNNSAPTGRILIERNNEVFIGYISRNVPMYTSPQHRNPPRPFLHAMQPREPADRNHLGQCAALSKGQSVSDTGRLGQKWWMGDCVPSLLLLPLVA